jgi:nucleotide-binding universal stress UspA family protein
MKILVPVDGSETSLRAIDHVITKMQPLGMEVHLINVQPPLPYGGRASAVIGHDNIDEYHREEGLKALKPAQQKLDAAGVEYHCHVAVGDPADVIVGYAQTHGVDQIVMGTHGRGAVASVLMGSVAKEVLEKAHIPVVLVK